MEDVVLTIAKQIRANRWKSKGYRFTRMKDGNTMQITKPFTMKTPIENVQSVNIHYNAGSDYYELTFLKGGREMGRHNDVGWEELNEHLVNFFYGERHGVRRDSMMEWLTMSMPIVKFR